MNFVIIYSLVLATIFTTSVLISSCTYCLTSCMALASDDDDDEPMPECVQHMYS